MIIVFLIIVFLVIFLRLRKVRYESPTGRYYKLYKYALEESHLLIAGVTGSGKSVFIDGLISTALYRLPIDTAGGAQFMLIDPKGTELQRYKPLPHTVLYADMSGKKSGKECSIIEALQSGHDEMMRRFEYNKKHNLRSYPGGDLYIIVDELAFLVWNYGKRVEKLIQSIMALGRAAKVHLVIATQSPRADVIPKMLTANITATIGMRTDSKRESNIILGGQIDGFDGLHTLPDPRTEHKADCYYKTAAVVDGKPLENLCVVPMVEDEEIQRLIDHWTGKRKTRKAQSKYCY